MALSREETLEQLFEAINRAVNEARYSDVTIKKLLLRAINALEADLVAVEYETSSAVDQNVDKLTSYIDELEEDEKQRDEPEKKPDEVIEYVEVEKEEDESDDDDEEKIEVAEDDDD